MNPYIQNVNLSELILVLILQEREPDTSNTITTGKETESIRKTNKRKKQIEEIEEHHEDRNKTKKRKIAERKIMCRHLISLQAVSAQLQLPTLLTVCVFISIYRNGHSA